jgi:glutamate synthase (NADPH/NADH) small chain
MDAARTARRLGADEVSIVYRRTEKEIPARAEEVAHAGEEGIAFHLLQNAKRILGDEQGLVTGMECLRYRLGEPDASGRARPIEIPGSEFLMDVDTVIVAIGNEPNPLLRRTAPELVFARWGTLRVDEETLATSVPGVYAGGDIVTGAATVILAMGQGKQAARSIHAYLTGSS